jgi:ribosomal protein L12E/L44/L45/RPP1/RPP2
LRVWKQTPGQVARALESGAAASSSQRQEQEGEDGSEEEEEEQDFMHGFTAVFGISSLIQRRFC